MRVLFIIGLLTILLGGCSYNSLYIKERDARNAFWERPLVIPPNRDTNLSPKKYLDTNSDYLADIIFNLIFNENINVYNQIATTLPMDDSDKLLLKNLNVDKKIEGIRENLNAEYLNITNKNNKFINKILHWQIDESIPSASQEYIDINNKV